MWNIKGKGAGIQYCHWFRRFVREGINVLDNVFLAMKHGSI
jgi:hypothetical protein